MNEYTMELVTKYADTLAENARLKEKVDQLCALVIRAEIAEAKDSVRYGGTYRPKVAVEDVNAIFVWAQSSEAAQILKGEEENGESV